MLQCQSCNFDNIDDAKTCQNCGTAIKRADVICGIPTFAGSSANQVLDRRYIIVREIAASQTGITYVAEDAELNTQVILRVLPVILCSSTQQIEALRSKAEALIGLSHTNIISLLGFQFEAQIKYLITEYVRGETLQDRISTNGPLTAEEMLKIFEPIAAGIDYAHSQNILHGDIRPANITLADDGQAKLDVFCLTKQIRDSLASIDTEQVSSPSLYTAPEQFHNGQLLPQSDIYSLAACIYQCLCSSPSFWRGWLEYQVLKESPAPLDNLTDRQNEALQKAFSPNPQDRQSSAGELLFELINEPAETIVEAEAQTAPEAKDKTGEPVSKSKIFAATLTLIILAFIALFIGTKYSGHPKPSKDNAITRQTTPLWMEALLSAEHEDYSNALVLADKVITKFPNYAEEQQISQFKTTWEQTLSAQNLWIKTKALAEANKYEQAVAEAKKLLDQYPNTRYAVEAEVQLASWKKIISTTQQVADLAERTRAIKLETKTEIEEQIRVAKAKEFKKLKDNAIILEDAEDWENAAKVYAQAMKINSYDTEIKERWNRCLNNIYLSRVRAAEQAKLHELMNNALAFEVAQDWENAIRLYTGGIKNDPDNAEIKEKLALSQHNLYLSKALAAEKKDDWDNAVELYDKALSYENDPLTQQKQEAVRQKIQARLQAEQNDLKLKRWLKLASKAEKQGEFAKAIESYENAAEQGSSQAVYKLGLIYHNGTGVARDYTRAMELFTRAAERGEDIAMLAIATMYYDGLGVDKDYDKAFQWYRRAGQKGNTKAMLNLGTMYNNGEGVNKDYTEANKWYRQAAEAGDVGAMAMLGTAYFNGTGVVKDYAEAIQWYQKAATAGDSEAMFNLGVMYHYGNGVAKDDVKAMDKFSKAANMGNIEAMYRIGLAYSNAIGLSRDYVQAMTWFTKAANAGHAEAMFNVGLLYDEGYGSDKDYSNAAKWYHKSSEAGNSNAMVNLGIMYYEGKGLAKNYETAFDWFQKAADRGQPEAMYYMGQAYTEGHGMTQDYEQAFQWYSRAAEAGESKSMFYLGWAYAQGLGVDVDYTKAIDWYEKSAEAGETEAMFYLGAIYHNGKGVDANLETALYWYRKAARGGGAQAKEELVKLGETW